MRVGRGACLARVLLVLYASFLPGNAHAQDIFGFAGLFTKFDGISVWGAANWANPEAPVDHYYRYGMELILGPYGPTAKADPMKARLSAIVDSMTAEQFRKAAASQTINADTIAAIAARRKALVAMLDSGKVGLTDSPEGKARVLIGVGFEYNDGYSGTMKGLEVRAPVKGFYLAAYVERAQLFQSSKHFSAHLVGKIGLYNLSNASAYGPNGYQTGIDNSSVSEELLAGLGVQLGRNVRLFVDGGYRYLRFEGLRFDTKDSVAPPADVPRKLEFSGPVFVAGFQIARGVPGDKY